MCTKPPLFKVIQQQPKCQNSHTNAFLDVLLLSHFQIFAINAAKKITLRKILIIELRRGWVFLERTQIPIGIHFTRHFINFVSVETNQPCRQEYERDLDASDSDMRPALEHVCGKQRSIWHVISSFRANLPYVVNIKM